MRLCFSSKERAEDTSLRFILHRTKRLAQGLCYLQRGTNKRTMGRSVIEAGLGQDETLGLGPLVTVAIHLFHESCTVRAAAACPCHGTLQVCT